MDLHTFQTTGKPVRVPGGAIKGWEIGDNFMANPDYKAPEAPPPPPPIPTLCGRCGVEVQDKTRKAIIYKNGIMMSIICCARCHK